MNNLSQANNQNSLLISLKDTLHHVKSFFFALSALNKQEATSFLFKFLMGISQLNYEYDGYLQRVLQYIVSNYSLKFQTVQFDDHFLVLSIESSFSEEPSVEAVQFRSCLVKYFKRFFLHSLTFSPELERVILIEFEHFILLFILEIE